MKSKLKIIALLIATALAGALTGLYAPGARAGQYDVPYPIRTGTGSGNLNMPYLGTSGTYGTIATTAANGFVQTTGSGLVVNPGPALTGTAAISAALSGTVPAGTLGVSTTGTLCIMGTNGAWRTAP